MGERQRCQVERALPSSSRSYFHRRGAGGPRTDASGWILRSFLKQSGIPSSVLGLISGVVATRIAWAHILGVARRRHADPATARAVLDLSYLSSYLELPQGWRCWSSRDPMAGLLYLHHGQLVEVHELRSILHRPVPQNHWCDVCSIFSLLFSLVCVCFFFPNQILMYLFFFLQFSFSKRAYSSSD